MLLNCGVKRRLLRVPWTARRSNQWILMEINPEYSLEGLTDAEALTLQPPDVKNWLTGKDPDAGKGWGQEEKGTTEDEMVGWHHQLDGHEFEQALGDGEGQGSLACCSLWGHRVGHDWAIKRNWSYRKLCGDSPSLFQPLAPFLESLNYHLAFKAPSLEVVIPSILLCLNHSQPWLLDTHRGNKSPPKSKRSIAVLSKIHTPTPKPHQPLSVLFLNFTF